MKTAKIILNQDVYNLGEEGDVCEVAPGYARNYLLPKGLAVAYNKQSLTMLEQKREIIEKRKVEKQAVAKSLRDRLESMEIVLEMPSGNTGRLFGSVTNATLSEHFVSQGVSVERKKILIPDHSIKMLGITKVQVRLYGDETAEVKVEVVPVGGKKAAEEKAAEEKAAAEKVAEEKASEEKASEEKADKKQADEKGEPQKDPEKVEATATASAPAPEAEESGDSPETSPEGSADMTPDEE